MAFGAVDGIVIEGDTDDTFRHGWTPSLSEQTWWSIGPGGTMLSSGGKASVARRAGSSSPTRESRWFAVVCSDSMRRGERGVTVTEMVVATLLLATAILAAASTLGGASTASAVGANRQAAIGVAVSEIDVMRSLRFESVAIPASAPGFVTRFEGRSTVADARGALAPASEVSRRGVDMAVRRMVTWAAVRTSAGVQAEAYKHLTVIVEWSDTAGPHSYRLDAALFDPAAPATP